MKTIKADIFLINSVQHSRISTAVEALITEILAQEIPRKIPRKSKRSKGMEIIPQITLVFQRNWTQK
jgi:hypothetical protein